MPAPPQGSGFINFNRYLDANEEGLGREAQNLAQRDTAAADAAMSADRAAGAAGATSPAGVADYAGLHQGDQNAYNDLQGLTQPGSLQNQVQRAFHGGRGQSAFDTALLGQSGQARETFNNARAGYEGLNNYLDSQVTPYQPKTSGHQPYTPQPGDDPMTPGRIHYETHDLPRRRRDTDGGGL